jgi:hypothetical protein
MVTTIFLRVWFIGLLLVSVLSLSDFVFRRPHRLGVLGRRIATGLVWPLALASAPGRRALFASFLGSERCEQPRLPPRLR